MKIKLTQKVIENLSPATERFCLVEDSEQRGLQLRVNLDGTKTWLVFYRINGQRRRPSIGRYPEMNVERARLAARKIVSDADAGVDYSILKHAARQGMTLKAFCEEVFLPDSEKRMRPRTVYEHRSRLRVHVFPMLGKRKLNTLSVADVRRLHASMAEIPSAANRTIELLRLVINKAIAWGHLPEDAGNPALKVQRFKEHPRERFLQPDEIGRFAAALDKAEADGSEPLQAILAIKLLLMTGCRRNEILELEWADVDVAHRVINLPDAKSKTGARTVHLSPAAVEIVERLRNLQTQGNAFVVEGHCHGKRLVGIHRIWDRLRKAAAMPDLRLHDLRHSFASAAVWSGVNLPIVGGLLGHRQPRTTGRYAHLADSVLTQAADLVGQALAEAMSGKVIDLAQDAPAGGERATVKGKV
jgi:integrase